MIHPDDVAAWIAQVRQQPEAAPGIIEALAARLVELDKQNEALRDELVRLSRGGEQAAEEGRMAVLTRRVQSLERQLERSIGIQTGSTVNSMLVFTLDGRGARLPLLGLDAWQRRADLRLVAGHLRPRYLLLASDEAELLLITDKGRATRLNVGEIGAAQAPVNYLSLLRDLGLDLDESLSAVIALPVSFDRFTLVTRKGYVRSFRHAELDSLLERRLPLHSSPVAGDYPAFGLFSDGQSELLIATRIGKGVRFPERLVGVQSTLGIQLDRGDAVAGAAILEETATVVIVGVDGTASRREMAGFGAHATAGNRGRILTRMADVVAVAAVQAEAVLWLLTANGELRPIPAAQVPSGPGVSSGKQLMKLGEDRVVALAVTSVPVKA